MTSSCPSPSSAFSRVIILSIAALIASCTAPIAENPAPLPVRPGKIQMLTMTTARALHSATLLHDGRVLICGGTVNANVGGVLETAEIYDPASGTFSPVGAMAQARQGHTATLLPDGTVLIAGGSKNIGFRSELASAEIYDPVAATFRETGPMTTPREGHSATLLRDGRVLIAGGSANGVTTLASAETYDYRSGRFISIAPMSVPRETHSATLLKNGTVLIAGGGRGGMPGGYIAYTTAEVFDPARNLFAPLTSHMTTDRVAPAAALLDDGRVLIAGGKSGKIRSPFGGASLFYFTPQETAEVFDPETRSFVAVGAMSKAHYLGVATKLNNGMVLITGGWTANGGLVGGVRAADLFDPTRNDFSGGGDSHIGRLNQTATLLPNEDVMVAGGIDRDGNVTATVEFYASKSGEWVYSDSTGRP